MKRGTIRSGILPDISVVRHDERQKPHMESGVQWDLLAERPEKNFSFRELSYLPGHTSADSNQFMRHFGRGYGLVLEGELYLQLESATASSMANAVA